MADADRRSAGPRADRVRDLAVPAQHVDDGGDARFRGRRVRARGGLPVVVTADVSARLAWPDDAGSIARVQLAAWREMYADLLAPEVLESLDADEFAERWSASLTKPQDARMRVQIGRAHV